MANREACEVYIEQEIKEGLSQGKTPYSIGKELSSWVEKLFETSIPAETLRSRARAIQGGGKITSTPTTTQKHSETPKKQSYQSNKEGKQEPGPGRPPKYAASPPLHDPICERR